MPYLIVTTTNARRDVQQAIDWENKRKPGLAKRFLADLDQILSVVANTPAIGSVRYDNVRCISTHIFQYLVHYIIDDAKSQIIVLRVLHTSREPIW